MTDKIIENGDTCMAKSAMEGECLDEKTKKSFHTSAGKHFGNLITEWLQNTRLVAEACYRMCKQYEEQPDAVNVTHESWKKSKKSSVSNPPSKEFVLQEPFKGRRVRGLLNQMLSAQFVLLETLWETYLSELSIEISTVNPSLFKDCVNQAYIQEALSDVLSGKMTSVQDVRTDIGRRFASCITRKPWSEQWKELSKLNVGLTSKDETQTWYNSLDSYFEMRNLIVHARGNVSEKLKSLNQYYEQHEKVVISPQHIDFFRKHFLCCVGYIEEKVKGKMTAQTTMA